VKVGILGGGQLGRMLALEGYPLGMRFRFLEGKEDPPVASLGEVVKGAYDDPDAVDRFGEGLDVVTYEFENVPVESALRLEERVPVHPAPAALEMAQDRLVEKESFRELGIPTAPFRPVDDRGGLDEAVEALGLPAVLKTRRFGYDGKGQEVLGEAADLDPAWERLGGRPLILEGFVDFGRELSILAVRGRDGAVAFYPLVENRHDDGILVASRAPAPELSSDLQARAEDYARRVLEHLGYVGVLAVELFQVGEELWANEMAPRVHNSGHWSLDGAWHSQFENHLRAVCGLPLGRTRVRGASAMRNLLGRLPEREKLLALEGVHLHLYAKAPRPRRKLGHVNVSGTGADEVTRRLRAVEALLES